MRVVVGLGVMAGWRRRGPSLLPHCTHCAPVPAVDCASTSWSLVGKWGAVEVGREECGTAPPWDLMLCSPRYLFAAHLEPLLRPREGGERRLLGAFRRWRNLGPALDRL